MATGPGTLTDDIYWAHFNPTILKLRTMPQGGAKNAVITELLAQGALLNGPVMVLGYSPAWQMTFLSQNKYTWFPALGYPQLAGAPSIIPEGPMPAWGIPVSTDAANYPPFAG